MTRRGDLMTRPMPSDDPSRQVGRLPYNLPGALSLERTLQRIAGSWQIFGWPLQKAVSALPKPEPSFRRRLLSLQTFEPPLQRHFRPLQAFEMPLQAFEMPLQPF